MSCNIDRSANAFIDGSACARDMAEWAAESLIRPFRRVNRGQFNRELTVRRDERQRQRERLARELHDNLLRGFLGLTLQLHGALDQVPGDVPGKPALDRIVVRMQRILSDARDILCGIRSSALESMSLEQALSSLRDEFAPGGGVRFHIFVTGQPKPLKSAIQEQIYLIGREALINALRHSEATCIEAEVEYLPRRLRVLVRDNGCGMDPKIARSGRQSHWGLLGMRDRAAGIGAQLRIWSRLGSGTEVELSVPRQILANAYA